MKDVKLMFYNETSQKISRSTKIIEKDHYVFVGAISDNEFNLFIEILGSKFGTYDISFAEVKYTFAKFEKMLQDLKEYSD